MSATIEELALAMLAFVLSHVILSLPPVRGRIAGLLGERIFQGLYALIALATLAWAWIAYTNAPYIELWFPATPLRHLSLTVMPLALLLVIGGLMPGNPTLVGADTAAAAAAGPAGMQKVTRHPMMWGIALWAAVHLLALGDVASLVFFGGLAGLALGGAALIDGRKRRELGEAWRAYERRTGFVPLAAAIRGRNRLSVRDVGWPPVAAALIAYAALLAVHPYLFGVSPWPL